MKSKCKLGDIISQSPMVLSQGGERRKKEENRVKRPV